TATTRAPRLRAVLREGERVTPLELFFDLVFVLAITQCTALMFHQPTWSGLAQGMLVLGVLWWSWTGYAWLTSVVDPEEGAVRIAIFAAMAAFLIVAICVPEAFDELALEFALAAALWWVYFAAVALVSARRLARAPEGRERNELARDSYSYLHVPMVAGIVLVAFGLKKTLGQVDDPLDTLPAFALLGGVAF